MQGDPHGKRLVPVGDYPRSDMEFGGIKPKSYNRRSEDQKSSKCLVYVLAIIVIQGVVLLVFATIALRARTPGFEIGSVAIKNLKYSNISSAAAAPSFNFTLATVVTVENHNFGEFMFGNTTGSVLCGSTVIGEMKIPSGKAEARATERMNVSVGVSSLRISDTKNLSSNMSSGLLELNSVVKLSGRVSILNFIRRRRNPQMNCFITLNLTGHTVHDLRCD